MFGLLSWVTFCLGQSGLIHIRKYLDLAWVVQLLVITSRVKSCWLTLMYACNVSDHMSGSHLDYHLIRSATQP